MRTRYVGTVDDVSNPRWPRADATDHIRELARANGIRIRWAQQWHQSTSTDAHVIVVPKPYNARLYMVALHELGHLVDPLSRRLWAATERTHNRYRARDYLACEAAATGWAIVNADPQLVELFPPSDVSMDYLTRGIRSHMEDVARAHRESLLR